LTITLKSRAGVTRIAAHRIGRIVADPTTEYTQPARTRCGAYRRFRAFGAFFKSADILVLTHAKTLSVAISLIMAYVSFFATLHVGTQVMLLALAVATRIRFIALGFKRISTGYTVFGWDGLALADAIAGILRGALLAALDTTGDSFLNRPKGRGFASIAYLAHILRINGAVINAHTIDCAPISSAVRDALIGFTIAKG
jgi:hypothetical protein